MSRGDRADPFYPFRESCLDLITHPAEDLQALGLCAGGLGWILEAPVNPRGLPREDRTFFIGAVADRDHVVPWSVRELIQRLRGVATQVDIGFGHRLDGEGVNACRLGPGALHFK